MWAFDPSTDGSPATPQPSAMPVLPKINPFVTVNIYDAPALQRGDEAATTTATCTINGQMEATAFTVHPGRRSRTLGAELTPLGLHLATAVPAHHFTNDAIDAAEVFGTAFRHEIAERCAQLDDRSALEVFEYMLMRHVVGSAPPTRYLPEVRMALQLAPTHTLSRIAREVNVSVRSLQRATRHALGFGVRAWQSRLRFAHVRDAFRSNAHQSLEACALDNGFVDASHLRRFVSRHTGRSSAETFSLLRGDERVVTDDLATASLAARQRHGVLLPS